jgi:Glycosyltransferase family 87
MTALPVGPGLPPRILNGIADTVSTSSATSPLPKRTRVEVIVIAVVLAAFMIVAGTGVVSLPRRDFDEYWSAGDVFVRGGNPYDHAALAESLRNVTGEERPQPTMMWNPPWVLPLTVPFALVPIRFAHLLWVAAQLGLVVLSVQLLWRAYGGSLEARGRLLAAALIFPPTAYLILFGQIGGLCLFGVAGFLFFQSRDRPIPAGLCVALTAIKPHLLFAFGLFLLLEALLSRRTRIVVLTGAAAVALFAALASLINPHIYPDYFAALTAPVGSTGYITVREWQLPLASYWLRMRTAPESFWVQFVPMALVAAATPILWWRSRENCDWLRMTPALVLLSLLAAPYGGWLFDLVLLLVPVTCAAATIGRTHGPKALERLLNGLLATSLVILGIVPLLVGIALEDYVWFTPLVAVGYWITISVAARAQSPPVC